MNEWKWGRKPQIKIRAIKSKEILKFKKKRKKERKKEEILKSIKKEREN